MKAKDIKIKFKPHAMTSLSKRLSLQLCSLAHHSPGTWACFLFLKNIKPIANSEPSFVLFFSASHASGFCANTTFS